MLSDKIWVTRKTRIYTEQRLIKANMISNFLVIWYSFFLVCLTIWNLQFPDEKANIFLAFGSIAVLVASTVVASQKFSERSLAVRNCYLKLDELYFKVKEAEEKQELDDDRIQEFEREYLVILQNVENHSEFDYLCLRVSLRNNKNTTLPEFTTCDWIVYIFEKIWRMLLHIFYFGFLFGIAVCRGII